MIKSIDLIRLRNAEFIQFSRNFTEIINRNDPSALSVQSKYEAMLLKIAEMEALFKKDTASPVTAEMEALDFRRDQALNGIIANINSYSYHFDETLSSAAGILQNNLKLYSTGIAKENYQSETAIINKLIKDWENKTELVEATDTLNLNAWIAELKTVNNNFDQKYLERVHDYGSASPENLKNKRAETMAVYYDLRKRLEAFSTIESSPVYDQTISELNSLIDQYNTLLKSRSSRHSIGSDTEQLSASTGA